MSVKWEARSQGLQMILKVCHCGNIFKLSGIDSLKLLGLRWGTALALVSRSIYGVGRSLLKRLFRPCFIFPKIRKLLWRIIWNEIMRLLFGVFNPPNLSMIGSWGVYNLSLIFFMLKNYIGIRKTRIVGCLLRVVVLKLSLIIKC